MTRPSTSLVQQRRKSWIPGSSPGMTTEGSLVLQKLAGLVERAECDAGFGERLGSAFVAVDHGEDQHDLAAGLAHGFGGLQRRAAGRGDVLDDHDALAGQALALGESLHGETGAVLLRFLA